MAYIATPFRAFLVKIRERFHASRFWRFNTLLSMRASGAAQRHRDRAMAPAVLGMSRSCCGAVTS